MSASPPTPPPSTPPPRDPAAGSAPDPGPAGTAERRRVTRRTDGHLLAGVASGIADHLRIDPVLARVGFVVLAVWPFPGFGLLLYLVLAFVLPAEDRPGSVAARATSERERGVAFYVGVALLVVAVLALLGPGAAFGAGAAGSGLALPVLLIGIGVALWVSDRGSTPGGGTPATGQTTAATASGPTAPAGSATDPAVDPAVDPVTAPATGEVTASPGVVGDPWSAETAPSGAPGAPPAGTGPVAPPPTWEPPPPRPRSPLGRITLGLALSVAAILWALDLVGAMSVTISGVLAAVLAVLGAGLVVGSIAGRARWLAWIAAPLAVLLVAVAAVEDLGLPLRAGVGDRVVTVRAPTDGQALVHRLGAGRLVLDLSQVASADLDEALLDATLGAGELEVLVPPDLRVTGRVRVEVGELSLAGPGRSQGRGAFAVDESLDVGPADAPTLAADLRVGAGQLTVRVVDRASPAERGPEPGPGVDQPDASTLVPEVAP